MGDTDDRGAHCVMCGVVVQPAPGELAPLHGWHCDRCAKAELDRVLADLVQPPPVPAALEALTVLDVLTFPPVSMTGPPGDSATRPETFEARCR